MEPIDGESSSEMSPEKADRSSRTKLQTTVKPLQQQQQEPSPHPFEELSSLTMPPESNDGASTEPATGTSQSKSGRLSFRKGRTAEEWNRLWQHTNHPVQPPETPIFGRAREVDFLQQQVHDILSSGTSKSLSNSAVANHHKLIQCVLIEGAAGSGKSCLVEERRLLQNMDSVNPVPEQEDPQENNQPERTTSFTPRISFRRSKTSLKRNTSQNTSASTSSTTATPQKPTHKRARATTIYYSSTKFDDSKQRYRGLGAIGKLLGTLASKVLSMDDDEDNKSILQQLRASFSQDDVAHMRQVWPHEAALWEVFPPPTTSSCDDDSETLLTARDPSSSHPDPSSSGINDPGESESFTATSSTAGLASGDLGKLLGSTASSDDTVRFLGNLVKLFVKTIAASHSTRAVVLVVDDLQWLDEMSLQILESLIHPDPQHTRASVEESTSSSTALLSNDPHSSWRHKILFLGLYRPLDGETPRNSLSSNHPQTAINPRPFVQEWLNGATMQSAKRLKLNNLSLTSVQELLADLLSTPDSKADKNNRPEDDPKLHQLASLVHNRTHGNPFYIRQLIKALQESGLIQYTEVKENRPSTMGLYGIARQSEARGMGGYLQYRWTWDTEEIEASQILFGSQESIQIVMERLRHFSVGVQNCLQLASCLGPKFELRLLAPIMEHFQGIEQETNSQQTVQWTWEWDKIYSKLVVALTVFAVRTLVYLFCVLVGIPPSKAPETSIYGILSPHSLLAFSLEDLETALTEGLLEQTHHHKTTSRDNLQYRFAHDKIFETSLSLRVSSPFEREALHLEIGRALVKKFIPSKAIRRCRSSPMIALEKVDDAIIFVCTDQLNYARQMLVSNAQYAKENSKEEALLLVYLNLAAGVRAKSNNSYTFCESYLQTGIELLETLYDKSAESLWDKHDKLVLLFLTRLADVSLCVGNFDAIEGYMTEVSERAGSMDTFHVHFAFLKSLLMNNKIDQLMNESLKLLQKLGMTFNKDSTDFDLKAKREEVFGRLAIMTDHEILELPKLKNKRIFRISQILMGVLSEAMYFAKNQSLLKIMQLCALEAVLDHGISQFSPAAFSFASFAVFDDIDSTRFNASMRLTNLAIALAKQAGGIDDWRNLMVSEGLVFRHWDQPHVANVDDSFYMYERFLHQGELAKAFKAVDLYIYSYYFSGMALGPLMKDMLMLCAVEYHYGAKLKLVHMLPLVNLVLNLVGESNDIVDDYREKVKWDGTSGDVAEKSYFLHLYVYREEWDKANELYNYLVDLDIGPLRSFPIWHTRVFFFAVVAIRNAQKAKLLNRRKWARIAQGHVDSIRTWVLQRKAINLVHKLHILEAMLLTLNRSFPSDKLLQSAFDKAIIPASRAGLFQDSGLAAALAAQCLKDRSLKRRYASIAQQAYLRWGAKGIVRSLHSTSVLHREARFEPTPSFAQGSSLRSIERFTKSAVHLLGSTEALDSTRGSS